LWCGGRYPRGAAQPSGCVKKITEEIVAKLRQVDVRREGLQMRLKPPRRRVMAKLRDDRSIALDLSRPGKPTDNAYVESFNATVRLECIGRHWFLDLDDVRED
jgi:transposase InsO family protein